MSLHKEHGHESAPADTEFDSDNAGWDPYVASLLGSETPASESSPDDGDEATPVMTISRLTRRD
jgi:hypothetical protein